MRPEDVAKALEPQRFHPFLLQTSNGDTYQVRHPEQVIVGRSTIAIGTYRHNGERWFERLDTVALPHVVSLVPLEETQVS